MSLGRGGEIPKGGCAGRARSLGIWPGGQDPQGFGPGGRDHGGGAKSLEHRPVNCGVFLNQSLRFLKRNLIKVKKCIISSFNHKN